MTRCLECGVANCEAKFNDFLALDFADASYGDVHHLTVSAYMLQHSSRLSRHGWLLERELLGRFIEQAASPDQIRREVSGTVESGRRRFKIKSSDGERLTLFDSRRIVLESHES